MYKEMLATFVVIYVKTKSSKYMIYLLKLTNIQFNSNTKYIAD